MNNKNLIVVQKYGGATLGDPQKIMAAADRIYQQWNSGTRIVAVVSAMGKTTDSLIDLAHQITPTPRRRELDMLLSAGERISMSLLSMALNARGCPAISFTGSQAGIFTDSAHVNAQITDIKGHRLHEALNKGQVVVLAGFQGVNPESKEITTLGRGGSDTTAVAVAAYLMAERCEILKDVPAVFTGDPKKISQARPLPLISSAQMLDMTFWGAKVLHYRSVELAMLREVPLFIGSASDPSSQGTWIKNVQLTNGDTDFMNAPFESSQLLAINSHETVLKIKFTDNKNLSSLFHVFDKKQIPMPQILWMDQQNKNNTYCLITGPIEVLETIKSEYKKNPEGLDVDKVEYSTLAMTCTGTTSGIIAQRIVETLEKNNLEFQNIFLSSMSVIALLKKEFLPAATAALHPLIIMQ